MTHSYTARLRGPVSRLPGARWGLAAGIGYIVAFILGSTAAGTARSLGFRGTGPAVAGVFGLWAGLLGACWYASRKRGYRRFRDDFQFEFRALDGVIGIVAGVVTQLVAIPLLYWPIKQFVELDVEAPARSTIDTANGAALVVLVVVVGFGAPMVEELFFRGLIQGAINARTGVVNSILASSLLFAGTHFQAAQFPGLFLAGVVFAGLRVWYQRLGPAIVTHAAFNLTTIAVLLAERWR